MITPRVFAKALVLWSLTLAFSSCITRLSRMNFRVIPASPDYLLQSPDARRTPFREVLKAYNGFEAGHSSIDLKRLMELRIEDAYYQPGASRRGLTGFLGTEVARYAVMAGGLDLLSVQPMKNRPDGDLAVQNLIPSSETRFSYYRLYYEIVFALRDDSHGSVLLGADSQTEMDTFAAQLSKPETVCYEGSAHCTIFPDACSVSVEMKVIVNGKAESLVWGTTLAGVAKQVGHLEMKRLHAGQLRPVRIDLNDPHVLFLSLLPGDQISWK